MGCCRARDTRVKSVNRWLSRPDQRLWPDARLRRAGIGRSAEAGLRHGV